MRDTSLLPRSDVHDRPTACYRRAGVHVARRTPVGSFSRETDAARSRRVAIQNKLSGERLPLVLDRRESRWRRRRLRIRD